MNLQLNVPLKKYTTMKVGGPARYFVDVGDLKSLVEAYDYGLAQKLPIFILGRGSNVLVSDKGYDGLIIRVSAGKVFVVKNRIVAGAGALMSDVVRAAAQAGLTGLEWAAGLPGTVAGAVAGNAGCFGGQMAGVVDSVMLYNGRVFTHKVDRNSFGYRESFLKNNAAAILMVVFSQLAEETPQRVWYFVEDNLIKRAKSQPQGASAGCIFRNPLIDGERISAGLIIDLAGCKGMEVGSMMGGAKVSEKHGNFFLNLGEAQAYHFHVLINLVKQKVGYNSRKILEKLSGRNGKEYNLEQAIGLEEEIKYLGDFD